jgi:hypothetical protein
VEPELFPGTTVKSALTETGNRPPRLTEAAARMVTNERREVALRLVPDWEMLSGTVAPAGTFTGPMEMVLSVVPLGADIVTVIEMPFTGRNPPFAMVTLVGIPPLVLPLVEMRTPDRTESPGKTIDRIAKMNMRMERMPKILESLILRPV